MKKNVLFLVITSLIIITVSCKKEKIQLPIEDSMVLNIQDSTVSLEAEELKNNWHITNKRVCIIFGYDFNSPEIIEQFTAMLSEKYGHESDGGLIYTITYPDSFKHGARSYSTELSSMLTTTDRDLAGIIILGAPENTHIAFAKLQDYWNQEVPYPVYALFPQDDVLGLESTCDFVLDKAQTAQITGDLVTEETAAQLIIEAPEILTECIDYMLKIEGPFIKDNTLPVHIQQMLKNKKIRHYMDPESTLQSINHFVLY